MAMPLEVLATQKIFKWLLTQKASKFFRKKWVMLYIYEGNTKTSCDLKKLLKTNAHLRDKLLKDVVSDVWKKNDTRMCFSYYAKNIAGSNIDGCCIEFNKSDLKKLNIN